MQRMPAPPRGETTRQRESRRAAMTPIDALADALQHDAGAAERQVSCSHSLTMPPACCWCGAIEHTVRLPDA